MRSIRVTLAAAPLVALLLLPSAAAADVRHFPYTYSWHQPFRNEKEIAYHLRYLDRDNTFTHRFEFEYGLTDHLSVAPYVVFTGNTGRGWTYDATLLEARWNFGSRKDDVWLPAVYMEWKKARSEPWEVEGKIIITRYGTGESDLSFNYIVEQLLETGASADHALSLAYSRSIGGGMRAGFEWIQGLTSRRINAGPVFSSYVGPVWLTGGLALPLNGVSGNRPEFRLIASHHWF